MMVQPFDRAKVPMVGLMSSLVKVLLRDRARSYRSSIPRPAGSPKMRTRMPAKLTRVRPPSNYLISSASIRSLIAGLAAPPRVTDQPFTVSVGAAVPHQVPLKQIPTDLASALNGFQGDDYVLVGNQLVIVDAAVRRGPALRATQPVLRHLRPKVLLSFRRARVQFGELPQRERLGARNRLARNRIVRAMAWGE